MSIPFLKPKLDGARFTGHTIPLDVLKDWAALEDMIVEVAKDLYLQSNPGRARIPKGFSDGFSLHLKGVEEGSALMDLVRTGLTSSLLPCEDLFVGGVNAKSPLTTLTPPHQDQGPLRSSRPSKYLRPTTITIPHRQGRCAAAGFLIFITVATVALGINRSNDN